MTAKLYIGEIHEVGGAVDPGYGRPGWSPADPDYGRPIFHPGHPDHGLPSRPPHVGGGPIFHPGHPDHGLPSAPVRPDNSLPWAPGHPDAGLPVPPGITVPPVPPNLAQQVVVLWHLPGQVEWHGKVIDPSLSAGTPLPPAPQPKA
jgi:hypothetical protein